MKLLSLDTSSRDASIAVLENDEVLLEYNFVFRDNLSAMLIPSLEFVLKSLGLGSAGIDAFAVGIGPGLFTGIRIGMATVKGLAFAEKKPVLGVTSLLALASKFAGTEKNVMALIDARKEEVYLGGYRFQNSEPAELFPPCRLKVNAVLSLLAEFPDKIFIGSGAEKHAHLLSGHFGASRHRHRSCFLANEIGMIALKRLRRQTPAADLRDLLPFYLRQPDAETNQPNAAGAVD